MADTPLLQQMRAIRDVTKEAREHMQGLGDDVRGLPTAAGSADTSGANAGSGQNPGLGGGLLGNTTGAGPGTGQSGVSGGLGGAGKSVSSRAGSPHYNANHQCDGVYAADGVTNIEGYGVEDVSGRLIRIMAMDRKTVLWEFNSSPMTGEGAGSGEGAGKSGGLGWGATHGTGAVPGSAVPDAPGSGSGSGGGAGFTGVSAGDRLVAGKMDQLIAALGLREPSGTALRRMR